MNQPSKWWSNPGCSFDQVDICGILNGSIFKNMPEECDQCGIKFNILRRKKQCSSCSLLFCSNCLKMNQVASKCCRKCVVLSLWPIERHLINSLRVRDLQHFLRAYKITTSSCTEKRELVDLVVAQLTTRHYRNLQQQQGFKAPQQTPSTSSDGIRVVSGGPVHTLNEEDEGIRVFAVSPDHVHRSSSSSSSSTSSSWSMLQTEEETSPTHASNSMEQDAMSVNITQPVIEPSEPVQSDSTHDNTESHGEADTEIVQERVLPEAVVENVVTENQDTEIPQIQPETNPTGTHAVSHVIKLNSLTTEDDVKALSVRQCKELLSLHRVDFSGIWEKHELVNKVITLWKDYKERSVDVDTLPEDQVCKICMDAAIDCVFLQCGHVVACTFCGKQCAECPICRQNIIRVVRIFKA